MPDMDTTVVDGESGHTLHHIDLATEVNSLRGRVAATETKNTSQDTTLATLTPKPAGGWAATDLADAAAVKHDGTVLRVVKMTQAAYDALATKVATTLYVIVG